ncbi:hypothetical protein SNA_20865 [Streptomyces natalensis ATCC 27448]|uniref:Uncharacterized protein n=1 Tax=Streptomyces natalensis ATCC 27448 TaxID=1240678 RepID=A0A0D7CK33_9ACTN|nr:hypothetical protein SNA_20865 [Streptomyces natalensis ATCC 27448]
MGRRDLVRGLRLQPQQPAIVLVGISAADLAAHVPHGITLATGVDPAELDLPVTRCRGASHPQRAASIAIAQLFITVAKPTIANQQTGRVRLFT